MADEPSDKKKSAIERSRAEVYGMPVDTIIESAKAAYPPVESVPEVRLEESAWTSIEEQMANPMAVKAKRRPGAKLR